MSDADALAAHAIKIAEVRKWAAVLVDREVADGFDVLSERSADLLDIWLNKECYTAGAAVMQEYHAAFVWHFASVHGCSSDPSTGWTWNEATQTAVGSPCFSPLYMRKLQMTPLEPQGERESLDESIPAPILYPVLANIVTAIETELAGLPDCVCARRTKLECLLAFSLLSYALGARALELCKQTWADVDAEQVGEGGRPQRAVVISARRGHESRPHILYANITRPLSDPVVAVRRWQAYCSRVADHAKKLDPTTPYVAPTLVFPQIDKRGVFSAASDGIADAPGLKVSDFNTMLHSLPLVRQLEKTNDCRYTDHSFRRGGAQDAHIYARNYGENSLNLQEANAYAGKALNEKAYAFITDLATVKDEADPPDIDHSGGVFGGSCGSMAHWYRARIKVQRAVAKAVELEKYMLSECHELFGAAADPRAASAALADVSKRFFQSTAELKAPLAQFPEYIRAPYSAQEQAMCGKLLSIWASFRDVLERSVNAASMSAASSSSAASASASSSSNVASSSGVSSASAAAPPSAAGAAASSTNAAQAQAVQYVIPTARGIREVVRQWEQGDPSASPPLLPLKDWTAEMIRPSHDGSRTNAAYSGRKKVYEAYVACGASIEAFEAKYGRLSSYTACLAAVREREKAEAAAALAASVAAKRLAKASAKKKRQLEAAGPSTAQ